MFYKLLIFSLFSQTFAFQWMVPKITKVITATAVASSLFYNKIENKQPITHSAMVRNANGFTKPTNIVVERNNVYLYGDITPDSCEELKNKLNDLDFNGRLFKISYGTTPPPINLHIQSNGGSLMNALYIVDLIDNLETPVNTYVDGYAASAASLISVMGKERYMTKNSMILIHQLSSGREGKYEELHDDNENLIMLMDKLKTIYMEHSHISEETLDNILKHDLWLDAERCKQYGLIDEII